MMQYDAWNIVNHTNTLYDANQGIAGQRFAHLPKMIFLPCLPPFPHFQWGVEIPPRPTFYGDSKAIVKATPETVGHFYLFSAAQNNSIGDLDYL